MEITSLDLTVVYDNGKPISTLTPADFVVRIDGNPRRVLTAEWIRLGAAEPDAPVVVPPPEGYSTN